MKKTRSYRKQKTTRKKRQTGGSKKLGIKIPEEIFPAISELLWLDAPSNIDLQLEYKPGLNNVLRKIMYTLGATEELLNTKCFAICGPTGVGKTKTINKIKEKYGAEVINMDTMQVYDSIRIGSGRTNLATTEGTYLYGIYSPNKEFHILNYLSDVFLAVKTIKSHGRPILFEGASKSLLDVIRLIFPNITIFGIQAVSRENIVSNITKRITPSVVKKVILELSEQLIENKISFNSPVLKNNPEVYGLIVSILSEEQLRDVDLINKINNEYSDIVLKITEELIKLNINLHLIQYERLKKIPNIIWFNNDDASLELLDEAFKENMSNIPTIIKETSDFNFINTESCRSQIKEPGQLECADIAKIANPINTPSAVIYAAKLNIPLLPRMGTKQVVLGTTKYLLPYGILSDYFITFAIKPELWTLEKNISLIECLAIKFIDNNIIRIVTTPSDLVDEKNNYRITATEICILKNYNYFFYKYDSEEFNNIYFCSRKPLKNCVPVDSSEGAFRCNGEELGTYLYF